MKKRSHNLCRIDLNALEISQQALSVTGKTVIEYEKQEHNNLCFATN